MAEIEYGSIIRYPNNTLQMDEGRLSRAVTRRHEGAGKVGELVEKGTAADQVVPASADEQKAFGFVYAVWNADGQKLVKPGTAIADGDLVEVAYFQADMEFVALLPNTIATTVGEKLKVAASGRVTNLPATPAVADLLAMYVVAMQAVTAAADDDPVLVRCL